MVRTGRHPNEGTLSTTVNGLKATLQILENASDGLACGGVKIAAGLLLAILEVVENVRGNVEGAQLLVDRLLALQKHIIKPLEYAASTSMDLSATEMDRVDRLDRELEALKVKVVTLQSRNALSRVANNAADKELLGVLNVDLDRITSMFTLEEIVAIREQLQQAAGKIEAQLAGLSQNFETMHINAGGTDDDSVICKLPRAKAQYDSSLRRGARPCLEGTRTELLHIINKWIDSIASGNKPIFWLAGEAGTGKSTIAHTIAHNRREVKHLGASFFFSRNEEARRDASLFISTIAYQLSLFNAEYKVHLATQLRDDPTVLEGSIRTQLERLIMAPISKATSLAAIPVVIIVDALDECSPNSGAVEILEAWADLIQAFPFRFRLFITSRPSWHIMSKISSSAHLSTAFHLHDIAKSIVEADIRLYLRISLDGIYDGWPATEDLERLVQRIAGLFILASTYVRYIMDSRWRDPRAQLEAVLSNSKTLLGPSSAEELDKLYLNIIHGACQDPTSDLQLIVQAFKSIVGATVVMGVPMTLLQLSKLLVMEPRDVRYVLGRLSSVIYMPSDTSPVSFFHPSFSEFVTDPTRCTDPRFAINKSFAHLQMAIHCLDIFDLHLEQPFPTPDSDPPFLEQVKGFFKGLKRIFSFDTTQAGSVDRLMVATDDSEIPEALSLATSKAYPDDLCYACMYFAYHLNGIRHDRDTNTQSISERFEQFYEKKITQWQEVIESLRDIPDVHDLSMRLHSGFIKYWQQDDRSSGRIMPAMITRQRTMARAAFNLSSQGPVLSPQSDERQWGLDAINTVRDNLQTFANIRGGRVRSSSFVPMSRTARMQESDVQLPSLLAMVPTLVMTSAAAGWHPQTGDPDDAGGFDPSKSAAAVASGKLQMHPDAP